MKTSAFKQRIPGILLTACFLSVLILSGCTKKPAPTEASAESSAAETEPPIEITITTEAPEETTEPESTEAPDLPPEEGMVRSPLTNEWVSAELAEKRPIAVMYPLDKACLPQYGVDRAEIFYEIMEEGSMSRQMGVLQDWEDLERIGNIRSIRSYYVYEGLEWDSILVHFGGPIVLVKDILTRKDVDNINGVDAVLGSSYDAFYRVPAGSRSVHTAYTDAKHLQRAIEKAGFERNFREQYFQRHTFARESDPVVFTEEQGAVEVKELDMSGCYPISSTVMTYNEEDGLYYRSIYGQPQKDAVSGKQLCFKNILIKSETWSSLGLGYLAINSLDKGREAWYLTGGKMIHGTWTKETSYDPSHFFDDNGQEIPLNTGRTMIFIARKGVDSFTADGVKHKL